MDRRSGRNASLKRAEAPLIPSDRKPRPPSDMDGGGGPMYQTPSSTVQNSTQNLDRLGEGVDDDGRTLPHIPSLVLDQMGLFNDSRTSRSAREPRSTRRAKVKKQENAQLDHIYDSVVLEPTILFKKDAMETLESVEQGEIKTKVQLFMSALDEMRTQCEHTAKQINLTFLRRLEVNQRTLIGKVTSLKHNQGDLTTELVEYNSIIRDMMREALDQKHSLIQELLRQVLDMMKEEYNTFSEDMVDKTRDGKEFMVKVFNEKITKERRARKMETMHLLLKQNAVLSRAYSQLEKRFLMMKDDFEQKHLDEIENVKREVREGAVTQKRKEEDERIKREAERIARVDELESERVKMVADLTTYREKVKDLELAGQAAQSSAEKYQTMLSTETTLRQQKQQEFEEALKHMKKKQAGAAKKVKKLESELDTSSKKVKELRNEMEIKEDTIDELNSKLHEMKLSLLRAQQGGHQDGQKGSLSRIGSQASMMSMSMRMGMNSRMSTASGVTRKSSQASMAESITAPTAPTHSSKTPHGSTPR
eukprot:GFYU01009513.1.p1 GENE.GFYU01009513.1~~GFYU01009513.1.p1  ORF type:complete len:535 (-),score=136.10 GFYU01009513.1:86-1690(-)